MRDRETILFCLIYVHIQSRVLGVSLISHAKHHCWSWKLNIYWGSIIYLLLFKQWKKRSLMGRWFFFLIRSTFIATSLIGVQGLRRLPPPSVTNVVVYFETKPLTCYRTRTGLGGICTTKPVRDRPSSHMDLTRYCAYPPSCQHVRYRPFCRRNKSRVRATSGGRMYPQ